MTGDGKAISVGETVTSTKNATNFGSTPLFGGSVTETYTITNNGGSALTLGTVSVSDPTDFSITQPLLTSVPAHGTTTFTVTYAPVTTSGSQTAQISFSDNVTSKNPFTFAVSGTATAPLISVFGQVGNQFDDPGTGTPSNPYPTPTTGLIQPVPNSLAISPTSTNGTNFGTVVSSSGSVTETFLIKNTGNAPLGTLSNPISVSTADNSNDDDFTVTTAPAYTVLPGGYTTFQVTFTPTADTSGGNVEETAVVDIVENDLSQTTPFAFNIEGEAGSSG